MPGFFLNYQKQLYPVTYNGKEYDLKSEGNRSFDRRTTHPVLVKEEVTKSIGRPGCSPLSDCALDHSYHKIETLKKNLPLDLQSPATRQGCKNEEFKFTIKGVEVHLCMIDNQYLLAEVRTPQYGIPSQETQQAYQSMLATAESITKNPQNNAGQRISSATAIAKLLNAASPGQFSPHDFKDPRTIQTALDRYSKNEKMCADLKKIYLELVGSNEQRLQKSKFSRLKEVLNPRKKEAARLESLAQISALFNDAPDLEKVLAKIIKDTSNPASFQLTKSGMLQPYIEQLNPKGEVKNLYDAIIRGQQSLSPPPNNQAAYKRAMTETRSLQQKPTDKPPVATSAKTFHQ